MTSLFNTTYFNFVFLIMICIFCLWDFIKGATPIISSVASIGTLYLAYKIYRNFDVKKQYVNKQLNAVTDLCSEISKTLVRVKFIETKPIGIIARVYDGDLFSHFISFLTLADEISSRNYSNIYVQAFALQEVFPFINYRSNPLIPLSIAKELHNLNSPSINATHVRKEDMLYSHVLLSVKRETSNSDEIVVYMDKTFEYKNATELKNNTNSLKTEIKKWLIQYGAHDINF